MIYLDHAATGLPRLPAALEALSRAASWPNVGRGRHRTGIDAARALSDDRSRIAELAGGGTACFAAGATAALNQAILGLLPVPRCVAIDKTLHNSARRPVALLGASTWILPHDAQGRIDVARTRREWVSGTDLMVVNHGSNVTGVLQPVAELTEIAHAHAARVVVDAAQTAGLVFPLGIEEADLVAFGAHKHLRALPGVGALVIRGDVELDPLLVGGTGHDAESLEMPREHPARLEAGTPNAPAVHAMAVAAEEAAKRPWDFRASAERLAHEVRSAGGIVHSAAILPLVTFSMPERDPETVAEILDRVFDIATRAGLHCAPGAHRLLGTAARGAVRASCGVTTTDDEIAAFGAALRDLPRSSLLEAEAVQ